MDMFDELARRTQAAVAATIKAERSARDWTRADLESRSGVKEQQIGRYERGDLEPKIQDLARIARAFDLTPARFMALAEERANREPEEEARGERRVSGS